MKKMPTPRRTITLAHGSGGRLTHELISDLLLKKLGNGILNELGDSALLDTAGPLAFTTDSFVVKPLEFAGGDIGTLAVCGTVNDLVVSAARPRFLSLAFIIEEGLPYTTFARIVDSIAAASRRAGVRIVTGDIKVVEAGSADGLFVNTSGVGERIGRRAPCARTLRPGDVILITGSIAEHGLAVLAARHGFDLGSAIRSDCAPLTSLLIPLVARSAAVKFMRDPTRGGLATTLNEIARAAGFGIAVEEAAIPVAPAVRSACELLGMDPLYLASEGRALLIVEPRAAGRIIASLRRHPLGRRSSIIGRMVRQPGVVLKTSIGTSRILEMLSYDPLPRIC